MASRREFLQSAAALIAAACARSGSPPRRRLPLAFSTLGCPRWDWLRVLDFAAAHGYAAVELRGLQETVDLTRHPDFAPPRLDRSKAQLAERGMAVVCVSSSATMHDMDPAARAARLGEARRAVDLARALGAPYVRVFGDRYVPGVPREATLAHVAAGLRELGEHASDSGVTVLIESHGDFTDSPALLEILQRTDSPAVALLWDAHHTYVAGREAPEDTVRQLARWIRHTHLKDSVPAGSDRRYVLTGTGEVPVARQVEALARAGYRGSYTFEWEKRWHPEIEEPEIAIAHFARVASGYLRDAGVREA
jgi:sugar phosphate isomerase/epimerase